MSLPPAKRQRTGGMGASRPRSWDALESRADAEEEEEDDDADEEEEEDDEDRLVLPAASSSGGKTRPASHRACADEEEEGDDGDDDLEDEEKRPAVRTSVPIPLRTDVVLNAPVRRRSKKRVRSAANNTTTDPHSRTARLSPSAPTDELDALLLRPVVPPVSAPTAASASHSASSSASSARPASASGGAPPQAQLMEAVRTAVRSCQTHHREWRRRLMQRWPDPPVVAGGGEQDAETLADATASAEMPTVVVTVLRALCYRQLPAAQQTVAGAHDWAETLPTALVQFMHQHLESPRWDKTEWIPLPTLADWTAAGVWSFPSDWCERLADSACDAVAYVQNPKAVMHWVRLITSVLCLPDTPPYLGAAWASALEDNDRVARRGTGVTQRELTLASRALEAFLHTGYDPDCAAHERLLRDLHTHRPLLLAKSVSLFTQLAQWRCVRDVLHARADRAPRDVVSRRWDRAVRTCLALLRLHHDWFQESSECEGPVERLLRHALRQSTPSLVEPLEVLSDALAVPRAEVVAVGVLVEAGLRYAAEDPWFAGEPYAVAVERYAQWHRQHAAALNPMQAADRDEWVRRQLPSHTALRCADPTEWVQHVSGSAYYVLRLDRMGWAGEDREADERQWIVVNGSRAATHRHRVVVRNSAYHKLLDDPLAPTVHRSVSAGGAAVQRYPSTGLFRSAVRPEHVAADMLSIASRKVRRGANAVRQADPHVFDDPTSQAGCGLLQLVASGCGPWTVRALFAVQLYAPHKWRMERRSVSPIQMALYYQNWSVAQWMAEHGSGPLLGRQPEANRPLTFLLPMPADRHDEALANATALLELVQRWSERSVEDARAMMQDRAPLLVDRPPAACWMDTMRQARSLDWFQPVERELAKLAMSEMDAGLPRLLHMLLAHGVDVAHLPLRAERMPPALEYRRLLRAATLHPAWPARLYRLDAAAEDRSEGPSADRLSPQVSTWTGVGSARPGGERAPERYSWRNHPHTQLMMDQLAEAVRQHEVCKESLRGDLPAAMQAVRQAYRRLQVLVAFGATVAPTRRELAGCEGLTLQLAVKGGLRMRAVHMNAVVRLVSDSFQACGMNAPVQALYTVEEMLYGAAPRPEDATCHWRNVPAAAPFLPPSVLVTTRPSRAVIPSSAFPSSSSSSSSSGHAGMRRLRVDDGQDEDEPMPNAPFAQLPLV